MLEDRNGRVPLKLVRVREELRWGWFEFNPEFVVIVLINVETVWALCKSVTGPLRREEYIFPSVFIFLCCSLFFSVDVFLFYSRTKTNVKYQRLSNSHPNTSLRESVLCFVSFLFLQLSRIFSFCLNEKSNQIKLNKTVKIDFQCFLGRPFLGHVNERVEKFLAAQESNREKKNLKNRKTFSTN